MPTLTFPVHATNLLWNARNKNSDSEMDTFPSKLEKLHGTQESIETLSYWLVFYRKESEKLVQDWKSFFDQSSTKTKLLLLYLGTIDTKYIFPSNYIIFQYVCM